MDNSSSGSLILTVCSTKGGVGQSTLTANLGALLADAGHRVLLVDTDSQATLSHYFPIDEPSNRGIAAFLTERDIETTVSCTASGCDLIRSDHSLGALQNFLADIPALLKSRVRPSAHKKRRAVRPLAAHSNATPTSRGPECGIRLGDSALDLRLSGCSPRAGFRRSPAKSASPQPRREKSDRP